MMNLVRNLARPYFSSLFRGSGEYWEARYLKGGNSGAGSYGRLAEFKAEFLNGFVRAHGIASVIELGCGDGNQLGLAEYPLYLGLDVSRSAIDMCRDKFGDDETKSFLWFDPKRTINLNRFLQADLTLSLDVIYHLVEDDVYEGYLCDLFALSRRYVIVYSSDTMEMAPVPHVRHRRFTTDICEQFPGVQLVEKTKNPYPNESFADFFVFQKPSGRDHGESEPASVFA